MQTLDPRANHKSFRVRDCRHNVEGVFIVMGLTTSSPPSSKRRSPPDVRMVFDAPEDRGQSVEKNRSERFLDERRALRRIGDRVRERLPPDISLGEYALESDMFARADPSPPAIRAKVMLMLQHDWPTIHENPVWCRCFLRMFNAKCAIRSVPTRDQTMYLFRKSAYFRDLTKIAAASSSLQLLPTFVIDAQSDVNVLSRRIARACGANGVLVTKENFSAGKEGVRFLRFADASDVARHLDTTLQRVSATCSAAPDVFGPPEFLVQSYEPRFETEPEIRLYFVEGRFAYAKAHVGTIHDGKNGGPRTIHDLTSIRKEMRQAKELLRVLPKLGVYVLLRFDFGPGSRLNEIEMFPDLLGGPGSNGLRGPAWERFRDDVAGAYARKVLSNLREVQEEEDGAVS